MKVFNSDECVVFAQVAGKCVCGIFTNVGNTCMLLGDFLDDLFAVLTTFFAA